VLPQDFFFPVIPSSPFKFGEHVCLEDYRRLILGGTESFSPDTGDGHRFIYDVAGRGLVQFQLWVEVANVGQP